jgi:hypothetical protein
MKTENSKVWCDDQSLRGLIYFGIVVVNPEACFDRERYLDLDLDISISISREVLSAPATMVQVVHTYKYLVSKLTFEVVRVWTREQQAPGFFKNIDKYILLNTGVSTTHVDKKVQ